MKLAGYIGLFLLAACFVVAAHAQEPNLVFSFTLGGGPPAATAYTVKVFDNGALSASSEGMPILKSGKLTKRDYSTNLPKNEVAHIVALAVDAKDFVNNPAAPWPDCSAAEMVVITGPNRRTRLSRRSGCIGAQWSQQSQVATLLQEIGKFLPKAMQGWP